MLSDLNAMSSLYLAAVVIIGIVSLVGVMHPRYQDNFLQRLGMILMFLGAIGVTRALSMGGSSLNAASLMTWGMALYAVGTFFKQRRLLRP